MLRSQSLCKARKMRILETKSGIFRTHHRTGSYPNGPSEIRRSSGLARTEDSEGRPILSRIRKLLSTIYRRLWRFDLTFERSLEESEHIRMDKRKTDRFRNPEEEVSRTTSTAIARPTETLPCRDGRIKIRIRRNS